MPRDLFDPPLDDNEIFNVSATTLRKAELLVSCKACSDDADIPFDNVLDCVTRRDPAITDYILSEPAKCPKCRGDVTEKTLVKWAE